jgi:fluoroquinolone transport system permease protein
MVYFTTLMKNDLKNIFRDRMLVFSAIFAPIMFLVIGRIVFPWITENYYPNLVLFYPAFFMLFVIFIPMIFGFVAGFLIMDERDENILTVLRVMPISRSSYLFYRMFLLSILSFIFVLLFPWLTGLIDVTFWNYLPIAILFAVFTPVLGLIVNIIATNKIQAFAIFKTLGSVFMLPIFALAVEGWLQYIFSPIPNFWTFMALEHLLESGANDYLFILIGFVYHFALLGVLFHLFNKKF